MIDPWLGLEPGHGRVDFGVGYDGREVRATGGYTHRIREGLDVGLQTWGAFSTRLQYGIEGVLRWVF